MLFILNSLAVGGSEMKCIRIANALVQSGTRASLAYLNLPNSAKEKIHPAVRTTFLDRHGRYGIRSLRRLVQLINEDNTKVVVAVNLHPLLYVVPAVKLAKSKGVKAVGLVNTSKTEGVKPLSRKICQELLRRCDQIVFGCASQQLIWNEKYGLSVEQSQVICNGVDHEHFSPNSATGGAKALREQLKIPDEAIVIGSIGRLAPEKSFDILITALARLQTKGRDAYFIVAGTGRQQEGLERLARSEGVAEKVRFLGLLDDVRPALRNMDIFVLPSSAVETFSNAALEAMAMGKAVVLSDIGGADEMVEDGKSGVLFPVGCIDDLTDILERLYDSREQREALGMAARERVMRMFKFSNMVERYRDLL